MCLLFIVLDFCCFILVPLLCPVCLISVFQSPVLLMARQSAAEKNKVITYKGWSESPLQPVCTVHVVYSSCGFFFVVVIFGTICCFFYFFPIWTSLKPLTYMEIMLGVLLTSLTLYLLWGGRLIVGVICIIVGSLPRRVFCCGLTLYKSNWIGIILTAVLVWANMLNCYF